MSVEDQHIREFLDQYDSSGQASTFFGQPMNAFSKSQLLQIIEHLGVEAKRERDMRDRERQFEMFLRK